MNPSAVCGYVTLLNAELENSVVKGGNVACDMLSYLSATYPAHFCEQSEITYWHGKAIDTWIRLTDAQRKMAMSLPVESRFLSLCFYLPAFANDLWVEASNKARRSWMEMFKASEDDWTTNDMSPCVDRL